jgi:hypothetical protein
LKKYYKFHIGPPRNFVKLCYIFMGSIATENYKYASTQSPLDSDHDDDHHVDLNLPLAIIHLTEGHSCPVPKPKHKSKGKMKCDMDLLYSYSSKHSTKGEEFYTQITNEFNSIKDTCQLRPVSLLSIFHIKVLLHLL